MGRKRGCSSYSWKEMSKIERLQFIQERFGKEFVLPYKVCYTDSDITKAATEFEKAGFSWGMRTDLNWTRIQGDQLPFILRGNLEEVLKVFEKRRGELIYIISHNILDYACNGVAIPVDDEHVFFEINRKDNVAQRYMYDNPQNLEQFFIGPGIREERYGLDYPVFKPEGSFSFDTRLLDIYNIIAGRKGVEEVTFSIRNPDKKVVIW